MPPRTKLPGKPVLANAISGWERSKISSQDCRMLKNMGLFNNEAMQMPGDESTPHPPDGFRLHQLTPNSILHISIFITLCECFLGIHPHWGLWKHIFYLPRDNSKNTIYNVGSVCICVWPEAGYFDLKFADSVQGWRKKWLYVKDESSDAQEYGLAPFDSSEDIQRVSEDLPLKDLEKLVRRFTSLSKKSEVPSSCRVEPFSGVHALPTPLMTEMVDIGSRFIGFRDEAESLREALHLAEKRANDLEKKLKSSEKARKKAEKDAVSVKDLRQRLRAAEDALSDREATLSQREANIIARFETQSARFSKKIARTTLERIFPHFFPKTDLPERFEQLAKRFDGKDDPALAHRQESLKIGVEGTLALVVASGQKVEWAKVAAVRGLNNEKWKVLLKDAKLFARKLIAILDPRSSGSASTAHTEVK
ncbi:hypothetical protein QYE76_022380 [Lolium multiflorum]|uniref:Transposase (putative) gypsy type domain-containing protein n=1 Tax=Lolium multiflorum TaxID=4521 RepID=A0AAD8VU30_LOLMU|nr:hypothetical protein QYE76_022380 [Lolium multiflorum]